MFITVEGVDGSGKSTLVKSLAQHFREQGRGVIQTREPGGSPGAEEIRGLILSGDADRWSPETELLLFMAARRDHIERTVLPALERGDLVICDRYVDTTRAYQGERGDDLIDKLERLHRDMIGLDADLTLIVDIDPKIAARRSMAGKAEESRFEDMGIPLQERFRSRFLAIAEAEPDRCHVLDGLLSTDDLLLQAIEIINLKRGAQPPAPGCQ